MRHLRPALLLVLVFIVMTGLMFPALVTLCAQALFPYQSNGSLVSQGGRVIGSQLIGQGFASERYFHPRPSAAGTGYDAGNSGGTNLGPTSDKLLNGTPDDPATQADESFAGVKQLAEAYRRQNGLDDRALVPVDAATRSASGLDPHISPMNANLQVGRVARARGMAEDVVRRLVERHTSRPFLWVFGDPAVNVLELNLELDRATGSLVGPTPRALSATRTDASRPESPR